MNIHNKVRHCRWFFLYKFYYWIKTALQQHQLLEYIPTDIQVRVTDQCMNSSRRQVPEYVQACKLRLHSRVQWFWHFLEIQYASCVWFGLEILRLVYKKHVLKYWTVSTLFDLLSSKKSSTAPIRVEKTVVQNWVYWVSKEAEFCDDFKNVQKSRVWQKGKKFIEKLIF